MQNRRPIQVLPANVAERIAAGEVIERPASVVKELVENSLDAGATQVLVALEDGGKSLIEIQDDGHGMGPEDLALCVRRHATSKLGTVDDLEKIRTLGFRGEALPSVAAVSELSILSRTALWADSHAVDALPPNDAYELRLPAVNDQERFEDRRFEPQKATFGHFLGSPHGTRIQARGLFAHIPARLKFLKSQGAEVAQVREWLERLALAHPRVSFRLLSDGRQILNLRAQDEPSRVRAILADGQDYPLLSANSDLGAIAGGAGATTALWGISERSGVHVRIHWLQGLSSPQMRKLVQVVNGRAVRDRMLQQALLAPFRQALLPGQFPAVALYVDIDPSLIDVNVHPSKTEIRFLDSRRVFRAVDQLVSTLIAREGAPAFAPGRPVIEVPSLAPSFAPSSAPAFAFTAPSQWQASEPRPTYQAPLPLDEFASISQQTATHAGSEVSHESAANPLRSGRFAGTLFNTYLFYELGEELALVDQHAAHERIRYEQLKKRVLSHGAPASQQLLIPEATRFDAEQRATLETRLPWLSQLGFEAEIFGQDTALFRAVPAEWEASRKADAVAAGDLRARLKNLIERVLEQPEEAPGMKAHAHALMDESLFERLASEACHSAVRAGDRLEPEEAASLIEQLFACEHPWNCPHGRPTVVRVPRARFEEWFQRRV